MRKSNVIYIFSDHKPAESQQLMDAFTQTIRAHNFNDFDFDSAFRTWENQRGYPYLDVLYNSQSSSFELTQHRFFEQKNLTDNSNPLWVIPINYATQLNPSFEDTKFTNYFNAFPDTYLISAPAPGQWYVFNKQQIGYYRVNYDNSNWIALRDALNSNNFNQIHVMNRAQLIDDSFAFANAGYHDDYILAFDIMSYLQRETDFFPFHPTNRYLSNLYNIFGRNNVYLNVRKYFFLN
jgi:aminopeptidase N